MLKIEGTDSPALTSSANMPRSQYRPERPASMDQADLHQLRELIGTVWLSGYMPSPQAQKIVDRANRGGEDFAARLAVRALRLEQALITAHERILRLEWQLAQLGKPALAGK